MAKKVRKQRKSKKKNLNLARYALLAVLCLFVYWGRAMLTDHEKAEKEIEIGATAPFSGDLMAVTTNPKLQSLPVKYKGMELSFNPAMHVPNWVSWELTAEETKGDIKRADRFLADLNIAGSADPSDYTNSGYDRGHMAPAGDMKWDADAMAHTFYMTNIAPQAKPLNTGAWKSLEEKCRTWARAEGRIIIVCGPVMTDSITEFIGETGVAVPKRFFKVVLAPDANPPRGIGFIMPNSKVVGGMQASATSIDEVERVTGHDFFSILPDDVEAAVEAQNDFNFWSTIK